MYVWTSNHKKVRNDITNWYFYLLQNLKNSITILLQEIKFLKSNKQLWVYSPIQWIIGLFSRCYFLSACAHNFEMLIIQCLTKARKKEWIDHKIKKRWHDSSSLIWSYLYSGVSSYLSKYSTFPLDRIKLCLCISKMLNVYSSRCPCLVKNPASENIKFICIIGLQSTTRRLISEW